MNAPQGAAIVQADLTILLEVDNPGYEAARDALASFAELVKSPEHIHTYRITPLSLWNAAASGVTPEQVKQSLTENSRYEVPELVLSEVDEYMGRYGRLVLEAGAKEGEYLLRSDDTALLRLVAEQKSIRDFMGDFIDDNHVRISDGARGYLKQALVRIGFPVEDLAGYTPGAPLDINLRRTMLGG
ncbi:MAG: helicase-associated domain-containing protein, partial [Nitrospira sp.]|nr:helicase-associated domain-containing protein [Nitrospira sp.]